MPYRPGDRVALVHTTDPHTNLKPGDEGTVQAVQRQPCPTPRRLGLRIQPLDPPRRR
jgi:hypothetical protein